MPTKHFFQQHFLLHDLDLHNKVNFASQESDCELNYGFSLIQKTFAKLFKTGWRMTLHTPGLTNEECMKQVSS